MNNSYLPRDSSTPLLPLGLTSDASEEQPSEVEMQIIRASKLPLKQEIRFLLIPETILQLFDISFERSLEIKYSYMYL